MSKMEGQRKGRQKKTERIRNEKDVNANYLLPGIASRGKRSRHDCARSDAPERPVTNLAVSGRDGL